MQRRIDLHIHTTMSDGALTPKEVIDEAYNNGVSVIAIADHDTTQAYSDELFAYAESRNIKLIQAVEISTKTDKAGIHVLGYNFDLNDKKFQEGLSMIRNSRHEYLHNVSKKLNELGYVLNVPELNKIDAVTKAHIASHIVNNPHNKKILLDTFNYIPSMGEFIEAIMNENCPAYVKKKTVTPKEAAKMIRDAHGKVVLAHPMSYIHQDNFTDTDILNLINDMKPDGLEANYLFTDCNNIIFDETKKWNKFAKENNLFVTAGSDFHNKNSLGRGIGFVNTNFILEDKMINEIIMNLTK